VGARVSVVTTTPVPIVGVFNVAKDGSEEDSVI
jgi:hypothetical protein